MGGRPRPLDPVASPRALFGSALRRYREMAGISQNQLGGKLSSTLLYGDEPHLYCLLDECVLYHQVGDAKTMYAQLQHLVESYVETAARGMTLGCAKTCVLRRYVRRGRLAARDRGRPGQQESPWPRAGVLPRRLARLHGRHQRPIALLPNVHSWLTPW
ncbi:MAG: hypothetical protein JWO67_1477 [Streptosporangiaceae bacterium]|jgi:hypothetical protein|nr:hypothetical protein [Streptosporangiaceae bacterium]